MIKKTLNNIFVLIFRKMKNDRDLELQTMYSTGELLGVFYIRCSQIIRGAMKRIFIKKVEGFLFCGKKVRLEYGSLMRFGRNSILEDYVYLSALSLNGIDLGNNVTIAKNSILQCTGVLSNKGVGISIGNNSAVGAMSYLGGQGGITIGDDVIIGPGVRIFSENHNYADPDVAIRKQGVSRIGVKINNNCWIGAGVTIVDGVEIGEGCVIGAGSVVTKSVPKNSIAVGVPAKIIKQR